MLVIIYLAIFQWFEYPLSSQFPIQKYMTYITHKDIKYKLKLKIILVYLLYFQITSNYLVSGLLRCSSGSWIMRCELCLTVYLNSYIFFDFYLFFFWFDLVFYFVLFYFLDNEEVYNYGHMIRHMTLYHKPRTLWKELEGIISKCMFMVY